MAEPQSGTFAENKNSSSASAAVVKKDAQIQTTLELAVLQENLLRNEQVKIKEFRRAYSQTTGLKISSNSRRNSSTSTALPSPVPPDFSNLSHFMQMNPSLFQIKKRSSNITMPSCRENISMALSKSSVTSEYLSNVPSRDHCAVEKLRVTEFLQTSFDHEWQENIFAKLGKFYPWKIQEPDEPSTMQMLTNSEKDLEILENLLTTFPFQTVYSAVQPPVTLPCLSLSTFFDTFMSHRDFIPKTLLRNYSDHALLHVRPQEIPEELFPSRPVSSIEDFELSYNKDGRNVQIDHNNEFGENIMFGNGPKHVISPINMNPEKSRIRYRNFPSMALKSIINRSKISDIFKWRLINKHWNSICCSKLEKLVNPEITLNSENHIKTFLQVSQCPKLTLFSSFSLNQVIVRPPLAAWDFLVRFGPTSIKRLELQHDTLIWVERFRELLQHLPNLEYLSMGITRFRGTRLCPDTPSEIIGAIDLPVLKKLMHVNFYGVGGSFSFHELLQDFFSTFAPNVEIVQANPGEPGLMSKDFREKLICGSLSLRKLKRFDFPISVGELTLKKLGGCRLPLQELILVIKESAIRSEIILKLLRSVVNTLKICEITFELFQEGRKQKFEIPGLKVLERLVLKNFYGGTDGLAFLNKCPLLKYMDLSMVDGYETMLPEKMPAMDSIEEIRLSPTAYCSSWAFQNILGMFPKLRKLTMEHAEDFVLRAIFLEVETLEELSLSGTFTDEGVTGIPRDKCKDVLRFKMYNEVDAVKLRESVCIGNLKNLYQLHLKSNFITDVSILHGVACVKAVTSLSLSAEKITDISIVCIINNLQKLKRLHLSKCSLLSVELQFAVWKEFSEEIILDFEEIKHLLNAVTKQVRFSEDGMKDVLECIDPDKVNYFQGAFLPCLRNSESDMKDSLIGTSNK